MSDADTRRDLTRWIESEIARTSGRRYRIAWDRLYTGSLRDVQRLLRDLEHERELAVRHAQMFPWERR